MKAGEIIRRTRGYTSKDTGKAVVVLNAPASSGEALKNIGGGFRNEYLKTAPETLGARGRAGLSTQNLFLKEAP